jgi:hypothetical protein
MVHRGGASVGYAKTAVLVSDGAKAHRTFASKADLAHVGLSINTVE